MQVVNLEPGLYSKQIRKNLNPALNSPVEGRFQEGPSQNHLGAEPDQPDLHNRKKFAAEHVFWSTLQNFYPAIEKFIIIIRKE